MLLCLKFRKIKCNQPINRQGHRDHDEGPRNYGPIIYPSAQPTETCHKTPLGPSPVAHSGSGGGEHARGSGGEKLPSKARRRWRR